MIINRRFVALTVVLVLLVIVSLTHRKMKNVPRWEIVTNAFMLEDKPYGAGDFRLKQKKFMALKLADPVIEFKPVNERKNPEKAEPTEEWMNDASEQLNRSTVRLIRGDSQASLTKLFESQGQDAAWWASDDWSSIFIATDWMDYKTADPRSGPAPHVAKLWRSLDGGKSWNQMKWAEEQNISRLYFLDPQRGYAIGWGPHIWRTTDGGQSWKEIALPPLATDFRNPRKQFEASDLGADGVLRVAYYVAAQGDVHKSTIVYRLPWETDRFEQDVVLPGQTIVQLVSSNEPPGHTYSLYALSRLGEPRNYGSSNDDGQRVGAISRWSSQRQSAVEQLHTFDQKFSLGGLDVGKRGVVLVFGSDDSRSGAPHDYTFYSKDFGKSWDDVDDGVGQGGWFDRDTNTQYGLYAYTLKKRSF